jgi:uncharacterized protein YuzE
MNKNTFINYDYESDVLYIVAKKGVEVWGFEVKHG